MSTICTHDNCLSSYSGKASRIGIYAPETAFETFVSALDILRGHAVEYYDLVEGHTRLIRLGEKNLSDLRSKTITISEKSFKRGYVPTAVMLVHEASHLYLFKQGICLDDEEQWCLEKEADCIGALGPEFYDKLKLGFDYEREKYLGMRILDRTLMGYI